jgi:hypothetical protein
VQFAEWSPTGAYFTTAKRGVKGPDNVPLPNVQVGSSSWQHPVVWQQQQQRLQLHSDCNCCHGSQQQQQLHSYSQQHLMALVCSLHITPLVAPPAWLAALLHAQRAPATHSDVQTWRAK